MKQNFNRLAPSSSSKLSIPSPDNTLHTAHPTSEKPHLFSAKITLALTNVNNDKIYLYGKEQWFSSDLSFSIISHFHAS